MNWITDTILIRSVHEARNLEMLREHGVRSVLGLIDTLAASEPAALGVGAIQVVPLLDGEGNDLGLFCRAVTALVELAEQHGPVFVHCQAGWSRSPAVVAAYLIQQQGLTAEQALAAVAAKRSCSMTREMRAMVERFGRECV